MAAPSAQARGGLLLEGAMEADWTFIVFVIAPLIVMMAVHVFGA